MKKNQQFYIVFLAIFALIVLPAAIIYARENNEAPRGSDDNNSSTVQGGVDLRDDGTVDDDSISGTSSVKLRGDGSVDDNSSLKQENSSSSRAEQHRSSVSTFVQNLLNFADDDKSGIGEQVREVAREQNESKERVVKAVEEVQKRSRIRTFFFGSDFKNIGEIRSEIVQTENRIAKLNQLLTKISTTASSTLTIAEIEKLKTEQERLSDFVAENENKFSLFGWFVRLVSR